jgi:hypothetical protein
LYQQRLLLVLPLQQSSKIPSLLQAGIEVGEYNFSVSMNVTNKLSKKK